jgi:hypothetical protein
MADPEFRIETGGPRGEGFGLLGRSPSHRQAADLAYAHHRVEMVFGLFAGTDDCQSACVCTGERAGCDCARRSRPDSRQQARIHHGDSATGLCLEQHHRAAMRRQATGRVVWKKADHLDAETSRIGDCAGHQPHPVVSAHRCDRAQGQGGTAV